MQINGIPFEGGSLRETPHFSQQYWRPLDVLGTLLEGVLAKSVAPVAINLYPLKVGLSGKREKTFRSQLDG